MNKLQRPISIPKWLLRYLPWMLSPLFLVAGITAGSIAGWDAWPIVLVVFGVGFAILALLLETNRQGFWGRRSTQVGTNALVATLAVLVILGLINVLAVRLLTPIDLTENRIYTLAPQSQLVAQQLSQPVKVWLFTPTPDPVDEGLLKNYQRQNAQFSYEYVDPQARPGVAQQFGVQSIGEVYLESGTIRRFVQTVTPPASSPLERQERLSERRLTNALVQLTTARNQTVYLLQGHGERPLEPGQGSFAEVQTNLTDEGYTLQPLTLAENPTIPEDAAVVIVASPQRPLLAKEIEALQDYQTRKSGLMLLIDPQTDPESDDTDFGLNPLLEEWGVTLSDRIIIDPAGQASGLGLAVTIVNQYGEHPITQGFGNSISFYPLARPLETNTVADVETTQLLVTSDQTQAQRLTESGELQFDPATDPSGPFNLGLALSRTSGSAPDADTPDADAPDATPSPSANEESQSEARLVVIGNSGFATDGLLNQQLNGDVFLNSISWLSQQDDQVLSIRPREATNRRILLSPELRFSVAAIAIALLPAIGFIAAIWVWWRRR